MLIRYQLHPFLYFRPSRLASAFHSLLFSFPSPPLLLSSSPPLLSSPIPHLAHIMFQNQPGNFNVSWATESEPTKWMQLESFVDENTPALTLYEYQLEGRKGREGRVGREGIAGIEGKEEGEERDLLRNKKIKNSTAKLQSILTSNNTTSKFVSLL